MLTTNCQGAQHISIVDLYPWGYTNNGPQGIHNELIKQLNIELNRNDKVIIKPYARVENDLKNGKTPYSFLAGGVLGREQYAIAGPVFFQLKFGIIVRLNSPHKRLSDLNNKAIAVMNGLKITDCFKFETYLRATVTDCHPQIKTFHRIPIKNYSQGLRMLNAYRIDGVVGSLPTIQQLINQAKNTEPWVNVTLKSNFFTLKTVPVAVVYSKKTYNPTLAKAINDQLITITNSGLAQKIYDQFFKVGQ